MKRGSLIALLVSLFFLYLFVFDPSPSAWLAGRLDGRAAFLTSRLDWPVVGRLLVSLRPAPFLAAVGLLLLSLALRGWRWQVIIGGLGRVPYGLALHLSNLGYMANNLLPMRLGEVLRGGLLAGRGRLPLSGALATVVLERLFDMVGILSCLLGMLLLPPPVASGAAGQGTLGAFRALALPLGVGAGALLAGLAALVIWRRPVVGRLHRLLEGLPGRFGARLVGWLDSFAGGLGILRSPWMSGLLLLQTALIYLCYIGSLAMMLAAYRLTGEALPGYAASSAGALLLLLVFVSLGYLIPAAPGAIGTVQYFTALGLGLLGAATSPAQSFALANHLLTWLVLTLAGGAALPALRLSWGDLARWKKETTA